MPKCIATSPEIASVGLTEEEALVRGHQLQIGRFPFGANAMVTVPGKRTGTTEVISGARYGQIPGVYIFGPNATCPIPEAVLAMRLDATPQEIGTTVHAHPTLSEAVIEAALDAAGETLHFMSQGK